MEVPAGVRWQEHGELEATLRPRRTQAIAFAFASVWNFGFAIGSPALRTPPSFFALGVVSGAVFLALTLRALLLQTRITFDSRGLTIRTPLAPWAKFTAPLAELTSFAVVPRGDRSFRVAAVRAGGAPKFLPLDVEPLPVPIRTSWNNHRVWPSPEAHSTFIASRLQEMLEAARRAGHDTYRS